MFLLAFLDKVNIANAEVFGMSKDLHMNKGTQYNNAVGAPMLQRPMRQFQADNAVA